MATETGKSGGKSGGESGTAAFADRPVAVPAGGAVGRDDFGRDPGFIAPERIRAELRRTLAETSSRGAVFNVPGAIIVGLLAGQTTPYYVIIGWAAVLIVASLARAAAGIHALRRGHTDRVGFEVATAVLAGLTGFCWGALPYLFALPADTTELTVLTIIGGGVVVTGALSLAPSRWALAAYTLPVVVAQIAFSLEQELLANSWLGLAVATVFLYCWAMSDRYRKEILRRLRSQDAERAMLQRLERQAADMADLADRYRLEAERAETASRAKSQFLANMSHEIRTPLNGVLGMATGLTQTALSLRQQEMVGVIDQSGRELLRLIDDILDLAKIEAGKLTLERRPFDLGILLEGVMSSYAAAARRKGLSMRLDLPPELAGRVTGDPVRLRQVLRNLLSNALNFTSQGEIVVAVSRSSGTAGDPLQFEVRDSGVGIPRDQQDRIFELFEQVDGGENLRRGGTGLGLAICRQLVGMMGGQIEVESAPGSGSLFRFRIDAPPAPAEPPAAARDGGGGATLVVPVRPAGPGAGNEADLRPARILAAEDSLTNQMVLRALLASTGAELTLVADGAELLDAWERGWARDAPHDAVLMDARMPVLDGLEATRELRRREAATGRPRVPVIALTANVMAHQVADYVAAGMDATIAKPIDRDSLVAALRTALPSGGAACDRPAAGAERP
ncbi:ATP-binding protein [Marinibaculum pumilum]|uniref:histidine kinase n=1 Tax=Marinibaculum pumilum TaxID=1766165 RepID=A0ABV7L0R4_9PROT